MSTRWPYQTSTYRGDGFTKTLDDICKELKLKITSNGDIFLGPDHRSSCYVKTLDGMCGIMLVSDLSFYNPLKDCFDVLDKLAKMGNYTYIILTHHKEGSYHNFALTCGYEEVKEFINRRTNHNVVVLMKKVIYD